MKVYSHSYENIKGVGLRRFKLEPMPNSQVLFHAVDSKDEVMHYVARKYTLADRFDAIDLNRKLNQLPLEIKKSVLFPTYYTIFQEAASAQ
jgi:hypothetical protein